MKLSYKAVNLLLLFLLAIPFVSYGQMFQNPIVSPEVGADKKVTFRILAPKAGEVKLTGSWMPFMQTESLMKGDTGLWTITVGPLEPELYGYSFIVDGVTTLDPSNKHIKRDGTWRTESVLYVPGGSADLYWAQKGPKGTVSQVWYGIPYAGSYTPDVRLYSARICRQQGKISGALSPSWRRWR